MDKKNLKRHELLIINQYGRKNILEQLQKNLTAQELQLAEFILASNSSIPAIVRREENYQGTAIPCGFVHPYLIDGRRWRLATFARLTDIEQVITPYDILRLPITNRNQPLELLGQIKQTVMDMSISVGVIGSLAMELYTRLEYTNAGSDIDLVIKNAELDEIRLFLESIVALTDTGTTKIDLEVELTNGYGIKANELFMNTRTILAKGKQDVVLLARSDVLRALK